MENIPLPNSIEVTPVADKANTAEIVVSPCYPGYGTTIGNALRRVLLSSLPGAAATAVFIEGVEHEFSAVENVKEDMIEILLNVKSLRFVSHSAEPVELELHVKGEQVVTAADFAANSDVEVVNPEAVIATLTDKAADFKMKITVEQGRGYLPVEQREDEKREIGSIAIDAVYTPIRNVNYRTENVRVGQMTNFDKLIVTVTTDGTRTPEEAFEMASAILVEQFTALAGDTTVKPEAEPVTVETTEGDTAAEDTTEEEAE